MLEKPGGAIFSPCRKYRYVLWRTWDEYKEPAMFIGLNPSTADETENDPTVRRCMRYARDWGYGGLIMMNAFAYRATDPKEMKAQKDPIGVSNDKWIIRMQRHARIIVAAWGNHGKHLDRDVELLDKLRDVHHLGLTKKGFPKHPLYLKADLKPERWMI